MENGAKLSIILDTYKGFCDQKRNLAETRGIQHQEGQQHKDKNEEKT
jgi:hypothetical protein